jgi:hypothetical protein
MTEAAIQEANAAFSRQVSSQITRITGELNKLEQLLSAGMADRRVVAEFRDAEAQISKIGEHVQRWLEGSQNLSSLLTQERIHAVSRLAKVLVWELPLKKENFSGIGNLKESIGRLERVLNQEAVGPASKAS